MESLQTILHIICPATILTVCLAGSLWRISTEEDAIQVDEDVDSSASPQTEAGSTRASNDQGNLTRSQVHQRSIQLLLSLLTGLLFVGEAIALSYSTTPVLEPKGAADKNIVFALFSSLVWLILLLSLFDSNIVSERHRFAVTWGVAAICEVMALCINLTTSGQYSNSVRITQVILQALRVVAESFLLASVLTHCLRCDSASDEETAPLLVGGTAKAGKKKDTGDSSSEECGNLQRVRKNWWLYIRGFKLFLPIIRPKTAYDYWCILGVLICLSLERILRVAIPVSLGAVMMELSISVSQGVRSIPENGGSVPWFAIGVWSGLMLLNTSAGIEWIQGLLWEPIQLRALQSMKRAAYDKLMSLSCDFHDNNKSDITFQTVDRGTKIVDLVQTIFFDLLPIMIDLVVSISVFSYLFNGYVGFAVGLVVVLYISTTIISLSTRQTMLREYVEIWNDEWYAMTESVKSWDAVSHFGRIPYEMDNFKDKTDATCNMSIRWLRLSWILSSFRNIILVGGLAASACVVAHQIVKEQSDVGRFLVLYAYWMQMTSPLHSFASSFNSITKGLVDAEKLLALFEKKPTIQNAEDAVPFILKHGAVDFNNVSFAYDGKRTVTNQVSFHAEPGKIIAFVGETGCGKSTLFKLLFRFYDPKEGSICIDGQDIKGLSLDSLRDHLAIVPQEPALFNKSVRENLRYPDLNATDEAIEEACKAVSLHEKIMSFTKGYDEVVGERGTKLSGGEKQRVAIARAILKNPSILLLDEATSSVDSTTEAQIQASLKILCADRTTFVIAHRLSTIVNADQIIVMGEGKIVESGTHSSLIKQSGPYKKLWTSQLLNHISELRGRSKSRSKCNKEHLLWNDLNSSDEDAKMLLAETMESKGYAVTGYAATNDQLNAEEQISSHEASHEKQQVRGCDSSRKDLCGQRIALPTSIASKRPPSQQLLLSSADSVVPGTHHGGPSEKIPQTEHERSQSVEADHDEMVPHSSAEAVRRRHQNMSEPTDQDPSQNDGAGDHEVSIASGVKIKRRGFKSKELPSGTKRNISHAGVLHTGIESAEPDHQKRGEQDRGSKGSKFKVRNGKISGGLKSVAVRHPGEGSAPLLNQDDSAESLPVSGSATPMLMVPANSPAHEAASPGEVSRVSEDGGAALDGSPGKD
jgi:ABC-type multidrug transport system fused ATPase/permease subunit